MSRCSEEKSCGIAMVERWWNKMEDESVLMYLSVDPVSNRAGVMRMIIESEGWRVWMSFPSSTMETRCPIPGEGYRITVADSISVSCLSMYVCVSECVKSSQLKKLGRTESRTLAKIESLVQF